MEGDEGKGEEIEKVKNREVPWWNTRSVRVFFFIFSVLLIGYVVYLAATNFWEIRDKFFSAKRWYLILSFIFLFIYDLGLAYSWKVVIAKGKATFKDAFIILYFSQLGKYLPGKIWSYVAQVGLLQKFNIKPKEAALLTFIFYTASILGIITFSGIAYGLYKNSLNIVVMSLGGVLTLLFVVFKTYLGDYYQYLIKGYLALLVADFIGWVAFYLLLFSIYPVSFRESLAIAMSFYVSWFIGWIALFSPGGLGIREGVNTWFLHKVLGYSLGFSSFFPLMTRVMITVAEAVLILIAFIMGKREGLLDFKVKGREGTPSTPYED